MDLRPFHHRKYEPFSDSSSFHRPQPHRLPPPPPPPPTIPPLPPPPPPVPPSHHLSLPPPPIPPPPKSQFSFRPNPTIEERPLQLSNFIPSHLLNQPRPAPRLLPPPRVSSYHYNNRSQAPFDDNSLFSDPWPGMPLLPSVPPEPPLHHNNHRLPISPLSPHTGSYPNDFPSSLRFRDELMDEGFRDDVSPQLPFWGRKETHFDTRDDVDDHKYRYGAGRERYEWNSDRGNRDFVSADRSTDFGLKPFRGFELDDGDYGLYNHSEADVRCCHSSLETERKYGSNSVRLRGERPELFENSGFEDLSRPKSNRVGEKRADLFFNRLPRKKQLQKRSALQRIQLGKGNNNNRNRSRDYTHFPKGYHDESNSVGCGSFKGKETDVQVRLERKIEEREKSPVELDVLFKSNALIAKAIKATPSPIIDSNRNLMSRNRKRRKINLFDSPGVGLSENLEGTESSPDHLDKDHIEFANNVFADKTDRSIHDSHHSDIPDKCQKSAEKVSAFRTDSCVLRSDIPSDSDKDLGQFTKKIRVSLSGNLSSVVSEPSSSGLGANIANNESPTSVESRQDVKGVASEVTFDGTPRKRKGIGSPLQLKSDSHEQTSWDCSSAVCPLRVITSDEVLSSSAGKSTVSTIASEFLTDLLADEKVKSSSHEDPNLKKHEIDINSSQPLLPQSSAAASVLQSSQGASVFCEAADHAETSVHDGYSGINFDKGVEHSFHEEPVLFQNGPDSKAKDSVEVNAATENKVLDCQMEAYTSGNEGCSTSSSEQRLCRKSGKIDASHLTNANSEEFSPNQIAVLEANDIVEGSSDPVSCVGNSDILCDSPSKFKAALKESTASFDSTVNLQVGYVDIASQGGMNDFVSSNGKAFSGDDNCQINLPCKENFASLPNNLSLHVDVSCVSSTNAADRVVDNDSETLFNNMMSFSGDVPSNLLFDMQNSKSSQSELLNGSSEKQKVFTKSPVSGVDSVSASSLSSKKDAKLGQALTSTVNTQKMLPLSQNNPKVIQNSNALPSKSSLSNNWRTTSQRGGFPGCTSVKYPSAGKTFPFNLVSRPRTWHRTGTSSQSIVGPKDHVTSPINLEEELGRAQNAYVRKGNSLVRKPYPVAAIPQRLHASTARIHQLSPGIDNLKKARGSDINISEPLTSAMMGGCIVGPERPKTPPLIGTIKSLNCTPAEQGDSTCSQPDPFRKNYPGETLNPSNSVEIMNVRKCFEDGLTSGIKEHEDVSTINLSGQNTIDERNSAKKLTYVKRKSDQFAAFSNSSDPSFQMSEKPHPLSSDGYFKRRKNQLIRTSIEDNAEQLSVIPGKFLSSQRQEAPKKTQNRSSSKRQTGFTKKKFSLVWTLHDTLSSKKEGTGDFHTMRPFLFPWRRATHWTNFKHSSSSMLNGHLAPAMSRKLLFSRKSDTVYKRSFTGFSLRRSKVLGFCGRSLKWSKSIERNSKKANEDATLAVVAAEKRKREQNGAAFTNFKSRTYVSRERIFRIGSERYRMDPTGKTLQRISGCPLQISI